MPALLVLLLSYLLGSLVFGVLYSRLRGRDIRDADLPGGSGTYRQYGLWAAIGVTALDILKGVLAVVVTRRLAPGLEWLATLGVTLGHCYPAFFRLSGGGGVAPFTGAFAAAAPLAALPTYLLTLLTIPLYRATLQPRLKLNAAPVNAVPVASGLMLPIGVGFSLLFSQGLASFLAGAAVLVVRALHMLATPERPPRPGSEATP